MRHEQGFMAEARALPTNSFKKPKSGEPSRSTKEVAELFGLSLTGVISGARRGCFPKPDFVINYGHKRPRYFWKRSTLLAEAQRRGLKIEV